MGLCGDSTIFPGTVKLFPNSKRTYACRRAIESMHAAGMGGGFMHSRNGLKTAYLSDEWFQCVSACIENARELGMKAYLYDEDRWPSGTVGGVGTPSVKAIQG